MTPSASPWLLDPAVDFLNHGSFGSCPRPVLEAQQAWRERLEREPVQFLAGELEGLMDAARGELAVFLGADPDDLAVMGNATTGVNAVLRSLPWEAGDEILLTDHGYNACRNAAAFVAQRAGARLVEARVPFPLRSPDQVMEAVLGAVTPRTKLALLDHVTSPTGLVFPLADLVAALEARGVDALVDGAHAPGMLPLDLTRLGAAYYTGNCHKWLCAPKGAAFLHVRRDRQERIRPLVISHGASVTRPGRSRFRLEFDWQGTFDPSAFLSVPAALRFLEKRLPGGWPALMDANRRLARRGRDLLCAALEIPPPAPDEMLGALAAVPLPDGSPEPPTSPLYQEPLQQALLARHGIQVPVVPWPQPPRRLLRISAQAYNDEAQYARLAAALPGLLAEEKRRGG